MSIYVMMLHSLLIPFCMKVVSFVSPVLRRGRHRFRGGEMFVLVERD